MKAAKARLVKCCREKRMSYQQLLPAEGSILEWVLLGVRERLQCRRRA